MKVKVDEVRKHFLLALINRGLTEDDAKIVAEAFLDAELRGKKTHGINKFLFIDNAIKQREGKPEILKEKFNYTLIDAHKELGFITAEFATDILINKVKEFDNAIVATKNSSMFSMAGTYARKVAKEGYIAIIMAKGGSEAVAPFGGISPLFGTNPIAIGIPTLGESIVFDIGTSERVWGEISLAKNEGKPLEGKGFLDIDGNETHDPAKVNALTPFGGAKGYGLNLMIEILTGAFVGLNIGLEANDRDDNGYLFFAYSPDMFTDRSIFLEKVEKLKSEIKSSKPSIGFDEVFLPGEQSNRIKMKNIESGEIEIDEMLWQKLKDFSKGS